MKPWEEGEAAFSAFIAGFETGTYPQEHWTHEAHVAMAAHYLTLHPVPEATRRIRAAIPAYNKAQGGKNTATSGYHESLTIFWIWAVAGFLASLPAGTPRFEMIRATARRLGAARAYHRQFYEHDIVADREARRAWVPPPKWPS